jgi:riboflavin kinase/FMN adenylyltransferase
MSLPAQFNGVEEAGLGAKPLHLAIGMFDGVHRGHRAVIEAAVRVARRDAATAAVLTFWPHPSALFHPQSPTKLIQDPPAKARVLHGLGVEAIITQPFTPEFAQVAAEGFLPRLKQRLPTLAAVYVGENFRFGRGRKGDVAVLQASASTLGVTVFSAPRVAVDGVPISSTRIRGLLEAGEIEAANTLLGYNYFAEGTVTPGKRLGRSIGFPTLNIGWSPGLRPKLGVYAVRVARADAAGEIVTGRPAVANYGLRPTVENAVEPRLEVHVLGECPLGAGDRLLVEWLKFLRPEKKFSGVEELRAQIGRDRDAAATWFAERPSR